MKWILVVIGLVVGGLAWWNNHLSDELDAQRAELAILEQESKTLKEALTAMTAWSETTDKVLSEHRQAVKSRQMRFAGYKYR